jgi:hypothetical protein
MSDLTALLGLAGSWVGHKRVLLPGEAPHESASTALITPVVGGKFVQLAYTWAFDGTDQEGLLLIGLKETDQVVTAVWIDSWHMADTFMICQGQVSATGGVEVRGTYAVPSSPDWGWRMVIEPAEDQFRMVMYIVTPDGAEALGVEAAYTPAVSSSL